MHIFGESLKWESLKLTTENFMVQLICKHENKTEMRTIKLKIHVEQLDEISLSYGNIMKICRVFAMKA